MGSKAKSQDSSLSYCLGFALIVFYFLYSIFKRGEKRTRRKRWGRVGRSVEEVLSRGKNRSYFAPIFMLIVCLFFHTHLHHFAA